MDLLTFLGGREQVSMVLVPWELMSKVSEYYVICYHIPDKGTVTV